MLTYILLISGVLAISMATFLYLNQKDKDEQEEDIEVYICDTCNSEECVCEKEDR